MNKLAPIALILLLSFGAALWYLADHSLNDHAKGSMIKIGNYYTDFVVNVDDVAIELDKGFGVISGLSISASADASNTSAVTNNVAIKATPFVSIKKITLKFVPQVPNIENSTQNITKNITQASTKNTNQDVIIIDEITLLGATFIENTANDKSSALQQLLKNINDKLSTVQHARKLKSEPYLQVNNIIVSNADLLILDKDNINKTYTYNELQLASIGMENGLPISLFGVEVLRKTIEKVTSEYMP